MVLMVLVMLFGLHIPTEDNPFGFGVSHHAEVYAGGKGNPIRVVPLVHTVPNLIIYEAVGENVAVEVETLPPASEESETEPMDPEHIEVDFEELESIIQDSAELVEEETVPAEAEPAVPEKLELEDMVFERLYTEEDVIALAQMAWGEALVTKSDTEMAATMWCVLNRYDSGDPYYAKCNGISGIVKQSGAFHGYHASNPVDEHLVWLAQDVLDRWCAEKAGYEDVGRVLPAEYLFFHGDGRHNHFRIQYERDGHYWDWSLESPYET